jgi:glyoxylase-like metal-dependent hydrolase (beta-lactamase superfamily II)
MTLQVGDKEVHLIEVGPAHTKGDVIVYVPVDRVVYTGDILFIGSHPIVWEGPIENWVRACDTILGLDVDVVVPGHGPLTDKRGVQQTRDYWVSLQERALAAVASGASCDEVARDLRSSHSWREAERAIANAERAIAELSGQRRHEDPLDVMARMARFGVRQVGKSSGPAKSA